MKKILGMLLFIALLAAFLSCDAPIPHEEPKPDQIETETTWDSIDEIGWIHENAEADYLLPLEDFSWEREYAPEYIVIHFTSAVVNHRDDPYGEENLRNLFVENGVSINYIILRDGRVKCYIPEERAAWHAGKGELDDEKYENSLNKYSIGIEIAAIGSQSDMSPYLSPYEYSQLPGELIGFTDEQYASLKLLVDDLSTRYGIPLDRDHVIGHEEYSPTKTDPGELFDWSIIVPEN